MILNGRKPGDPNLPGLLVSYIYYAQARFPTYQPTLGYRDWVLDSGAFTALNLGRHIDLQDYIDFCKRVAEADKTLVEIYALDVINDWRATLANTEAMWKQGVEAIPCFHYREPWDVLVGYCRDYPKVALGGIAMVRGPNRLRWLEQCFARVWPKKIHGFGVAQRTCILGVPMHSSDSSTWEQNPCSWGRWKNLAGSVHAPGTAKAMSVKGGDQSLRNEIDWYLELERLARHRWRKEMLEIHTDDDLAVRLVAGASERSMKALRSKKEGPE